MLSRIFGLFAQVERHAGACRGRAGHRAVAGQEPDRDARRQRSRPTAPAPARGASSSSAGRSRPRKPRQVSKAPPEEVPATERAVRVLLVDDNVDAAESLAMLLRLWGHEVAVAHDGPAALRAAEAQRPEVALLDIGLPGMDGYELARRLRSQPGLGRAVLVALTGWGQEEDRRRSQEAGFDHHLTKPVELSALQELLAQTQPQRASS